jgi:hypothetical protein
MKTMEVEEEVQEVGKAKLSSVPKLTQINTVWLGCDSDCKVKWSPNLQVA